MCTTASFLLCKRKNPRQTLMGILTVTVTYCTFALYSHQNDIGETYILKELFDTS